MKNKEGRKKSAKQNLNEFETGNREKQREKLAL